MILHYLFPVDFRQTPQNLSTRQLGLRPFQSYDNLTKVSPWESFHKEINSKTLIQQTQNLNALSLQKFFPNSSLSISGTILKNVQNLAENNSKPLPNYLQEGNETATNDVQLAIGDSSLTQIPAKRIPDSKMNQEEGKVGLSPEKSTGNHFSFSQIQQKLKSAANFSTRYFKIMYNDIQTPSDIKKVMLISILVLLLILSLILRNKFLAGLFKKFPFKRSQKPLTGKKFLRDLKSKQMKNFQKQRHCQFFQTQQFQTDCEQNRLTDTSFESSLGYSRENSMLLRHSIQMKQQKIKNKSKLSRDSINQQQDVINLDIENFLKDIDSELKKSENYIEFISESGESNIYQQQLNCSDLKYSCDQ